MRLKGCSYSRSVLDGFAQYFVPNIAESSQKMSRMSCEVKWKTTGSTSTLSIKSHPKMAFSSDNEHGHMQPRHTCSQAGVRLGGEQLSSTSSTTNLSLSIAGIHSSTNRNHRISTSHLRHMHLHPFTYTLQICKKCQSLLSDRKGELGPFR